MKWNIKKGIDDETYTVTVEDDAGATRVVFCGDLHQLVPFGHALVSVGEESCCYINLSGEISPVGCGQEMENDEPVADVVCGGK